MIFAELTSLDEVRRGGMFKYVRMPDESLRFSDVCTMPEHRHMIHATEIAISAGTVRVGYDDSRSLRMETYGSVTLGIKEPLEDDLDRISTLLWGSPLTP